MTWKEIVAYAHQGVEPKQIPGLEQSKPQVAARAPVAESRKESATEAPAARPAVLTKRGADALVRVERLMDDATRALATSSGGPSKTTDAQGAAPPRPGSFASATSSSAPPPWCWTGA